MVFCYNNLRIQRKRQKSVICRCYTLKLSLPCFYTEESKTDYVCFHHHYREQNSYDFSNDGITKKKKKKPHSILLLSMCCIYRYVLQNGGQLCLHQVFETGLSVNEQQQQQCFDQDTQILNIVLLNHFVPSIV